MLSRKAQSTLEYVIVLTAIVAAILVAANKFVKPRIENSLDSLTNEMQKEVGKIKF